MKEDQNTLRLYDDLAWLWPIWGSPEEYADYCNHVTRLIREHAHIPVHSLLNIGFGGGKNVFNLKQEYGVTGLDLSSRMLELARDLNPECEFEQGDMRSFAKVGPLEIPVTSNRMSAIRNLQSLVLYLTAPALDSFV